MSYLLRHTSTGTTSLLLGLVVACGSVGCATRDYVFGVNGQVRDAVGKPVSGARVTLQTEVPVYEAITPASERAVETEEGGGFVFMYITHHRPTPYTLLIEKHGCGSQTLRAGAPPNQEHVITLQCASASQALPEF